MSKKKAKKKAKKKCSKKERQVPVSEPPEAPAVTECSPEEGCARGIEAVEQIAPEAVAPTTVIPEKAPGLDPELIARAKNYGFSDQQIKGYTTNGALQQACDRCTPPMVVTGREGKPEPKARRHSPNQIPSGCKDYPLHIQAITEKARIQTRNRLAYDHGIAQSCVLSFVRAHRQEGQVFCKKIVYSQDNQPNKNGELVTDIDIVMAV